MKEAGAVEPPPRFGVRLLVPWFRVCVVVVTLSVLLTLAVVLPTRVDETTLLFLLVVFVWP